MMESGMERDVYLPRGNGLITRPEKSTQVAGMILVGTVQAVILVRDGSVPHIKLAQNTGEMDWSQIELKVYAADASG